MIVKYQGREYDYFGNPLAFHKMLTELNQIQLSKT